MKTFFLTLTLFVTSNLLSQTNVTLPSDTTKNIVNNSKIVRGIDISKTSENEQGLIIYIESLSDEDALEFLKTFVVGEIIYKEN